jgi:cell division protein FtsN
LLLLLLSPFSTWTRAARPWSVVLIVAAVVVAVVVLVLSTVEQSSKRLPFIQQSKAHDLCSKARWQFLVLLLHLLDTTNK